MYFTIHPNWADYCTANIEWQGDNGLNTLYDEFYMKLEFIIDHHESYSSGSEAYIDFILQYDADNYMVSRFQKSGTGIKTIHWSKRSGSAGTFLQEDPVPVDENLTVWFYGSKDLNYIYYELFDASGTSLGSQSHSNSGYSTTRYMQPIIRIYPPTTGRLGLILNSWEAWAVSGPSVSSSNELMQRPWKQPPFQYALEDYSYVDFLGDYENGDYTRTIN